MGFFVSFLFFTEYADLLIFTISLSQTFVSSNLNLPYLNRVKISYLEYFY